MLSLPSFLAPASSFASRSAPLYVASSAITGLVFCAAAGRATPAAASAAARSRDRRFMSVGFLFQFLSPEEELAPDLLPLVVLVEGDHGVDHLEGEFVEVGVHREARGNAVALLEDGLALLRQHEVDEGHRGVRV